MARRVERAGLSGWGLPRNSGGTDDAHSITRGLLTAAVADRRASRKPAAGKSVASDVALAEAPSMSTAQASLTQQIVRAPA